ncbi:hypothetical protein K0B96_07450 [Horticoccus luteus]|uniref:Uncharacterized protein n=1 Tax=Horticoccus luteus TaxID=2862869 RepID=A0A8F9TZM3_9BACT|nr:hypothetical protein [Horticoccus luteus]QYM80432.1 hypothetical protein K0B96_07450 [Horticoccus luteus]
MSKTRRQLLLAVADAIGGRRGAGMRAALDSQLLHDLEVWDELLSEAEFELQVAQLARRLSTDDPGLGRRAFEPPETWGLAN